jgi:hypothetical protein
MHKSFNLRACGEPFDDFNVQTPAVSIKTICIILFFNSHARAEPHFKIDEH